jgi:uncharacterized RDD family membrane protein YckC
MDRQTLQGQYSGFVSRAIAYILDTLLISFIILVTYWLFSQLLQYFVRIQVGACAPVQGFDLIRISCHAASWVLNIFAIGFAPIYFLFFWILAGQTIGQSLLGVRVVRLNGRRMTLLSGIRRLLGYVACFLSLGIGFLWVLIDDRRQGWHDKIAGTCVIYTWEARQNEHLLQRLQAWINRRKTAASSEAGEDEDLSTSPVSRTEDELVLQRTQDES